MRNIDKYASAVQFLQATALFLRRGDAGQVEEALRECIKKLDGVPRLRNSAALDLGIDWPVKEEL